MQKAFRGAAPVAALALSLSIAACGDDDAATSEATSGSGASGSGASGSGAAGSGASGSGASGGTGGPDTQAPVVELLFPPSGGIIGTSVTVRGTAEDQSAITELTINGAPVESDDGFGHWSAVVDLTAGDNTLTIATSDAAGNANQDAATVSIESLGALSAVGSGPPLIASYGAAVRADASRAYFVDDIPDGIIEVDLVTGVRTLIITDDPADAGSPQDIVRPLAVAPSSTESLFFMVDSGAEALLGADASDDTHWTIASASIGSGPWSYPSKIQLGAGEGSAFVLESGLGTVLEVDLQTGVRTPITDSPLDEPLGLGVSADKSLVYTAEPYTPALLEIDPTDGAVRVVTSDQSGGGAPFGRPTQVGVAPETGEAVVWDADHQALLGVDVATGQRRVIADAQVGRGHDLDAIDDLATTLGWVLVLDADNLALVAVDTVSGDRVIVAK